MLGFIGFQGGGYSTLANFITRPIDGFSNRIYLGALGPKFIIPLAETTMAESWLQHWRNNSDQRTVKDLRFWVFLCSMIFFVSLGYIPLGVIPFHDGSLALQRIALFTIGTLGLYSFFRHSHAVQSKMFQEKFPTAVRETTTIKRIYRITHIFVPRWFFVLFMSLAAGLLIQTFTNQRAFEILQNFDNADMLFRSITQSMVCILLFLWGISGMALHNSFRQRFNRAPRNEDIRENVEWFDR